MSEPRATRIQIPDRPEIATELWMGGADTGVGEPLHPEDLRDAWVIDCAGDMPAHFREAAALWVSRVFHDVEEAPAGYHRIAALARSLGRCLTGTVEDRHGWEHPPEPPRRIYVLCKQGLNRSGLVMGRILRELGLPGEEALRALTRHRPGAVNNLTFAQLIRGEEGDRSRDPARIAGANQRE